MDLAGLRAEVDRLVAADPASLADRSGIVELRRQLDRLDAVNARAVAAFDASEEWAADGATNSVIWLAVETRHSKRDIRRQRRLGRLVRHLPATEQAWLDGRVCEDHVALVDSVRNPRTRDALARDEKLLLGDVDLMTFAEWERIVRYWAQGADPDGADQSAEAQREARAVHRSQSIGGMWFEKSTYDPISGTIVDDEMRRIEKRLFEADWAEASERLGRRPRTDELARTPAQRRADAMVEMATRSAMADEAGGRPRALFSVLVDYETLHGRICELANGTVIAPGALVPWLDEALIERIVFDPTGRVIDVGKRRRLFRGATRRAVQASFRTCFHKYCDIPASECQIDHIEPYGAGGTTETINGRPGCRHHNDARNAHSPP